MVATERQGEHGGVELLLGEIQAAALGLKAAWGLALGIGKEAADMGLLFKGASACGSCQNTVKSGQWQTLIGTESSSRMSTRWEMTPTCGLGW